MHRNQALLATTACLALALSSGCKQTPAAADDASLTAAVQSRLSADSALGSEPIQASVQGGIATLSGSVTNPAARALAANDAAQIAGIRTVVNNLTVQTAAVAPPPVAAPEPLVQPDPARPAPRPVRREPRSRASVVDQPAQSRASRPSDTATSSVSSVPQPSGAPPAPAAAPAPVVPAVREVTLAAGTVLPVRLTQTLDSATTQEGQTFSGTLASDILADGLVALPAGTAVSGRVEAVQEAAHFKGNSLLTISLTGISRRGDRVAISTEPYSKAGNGRGKNTAEKVGGGAAVGAILGGIFGGGKGAGIGAAAGGGLGAGANAITRGQQVQIPLESLIRFRLTSAINLRVRPGDRTDRPDSPAPDRRPLE